MKIIVADVKNTIRHPITSESSSKTIPTKIGTKMHTTLDIVVAMPVNVPAKFGAISIGFIYPMIHQNEIENSY